MEKEQKAGAGAVQVGVGENAGVKGAGDAEGLSYTERVAIHITQARIEALRALQLDSLTEAEEIVIRAVEDSLCRSRDLVLMVIENRK